MKELGKNGYKKTTPTTGTYKTLYAMNIRCNPDKKSKQLLVKELAASDKTKVKYTKPNAKAIYKKGITFKVTEIKQNGKVYWGKCPSGWVCLKGVIRTYCKKI
jgi:hypothetical protein